MAARVLISIEDAVLTFGGKPLFNGVFLYVAEGDKICLIGKNGAGKTTLMRLIMGELELDAGKRGAVPGLSIGYLEQTVRFNAADSVRKFVMSGLKDGDGEDKEHLADMIIAPLALEPQAIMSTLSGGQLRRAALARALIAAPDILLLDEPTNHLDLNAIEWLEKYLAAYRGALICVSHDRAFLAAISRKVFWIDRGLIRTCPKGYRVFDEWAEKCLEQEARELHNMQKKLAAEIDWTQGGVTGRRKRNQRRLRELENLREKIRSDRSSYNQATNTIEIDALNVSASSKRLVEFKQVSKSFTENNQEKPILKDFNFLISRGDRIGILGRNGSGKSTFLKLLVGELAQDSGHIFRGKTLDISYFDQNRTSLNPKKTLWETLVPSGGDYIFLGGSEEKARHVCGYLKDFLFDPKIARDRVSTLSGGQQNRLLLAKILANPGNMLILDEPTNDLDMDTLDMLQEVLAEYQGTLLIVSHDRDFLDRTVAEVLVFEGDGKVESHIGGYSDYLRHKTGKSLENSARKKIKTTITPVSEAKIPEKKSGKISYKFKHELEQLPLKIKTLEEKILKLRKTLADADLYTSNPELFDAASYSLPEAETALEDALQRWLVLEEMQIAE